MSVSDYLDMSDEVYICSTGETFDSIAKELWNDETKAADLICANPTIGNKMILEEGDILDLPVIYTPDEDPEEDEYSEGVTITVAPWKKAGDS